MTDDIKPKPPARSRTGKAPAKAITAKAASKPAQTTSRPLRGDSRHLRVVTDTTGDNTGSPKAKTRVRTGINVLTGLTEKQEAFAQAVASGSNLSDAYRSSYEASGMADSTIWTQASLLLSNQKVTARLMVLNSEKEQQRRMMAVSRAERVLQRLEGLADNAVTESVRVRANELLGKTAGLFTDQVEITDTTDRSVADIQQSITDRLKRLGIAG
jgi:hypothetical protein